jgi:alpha-tubulin suppressor-like RCC1 family protein
MVYVIVLHVIVVEKSIVGAIINGDIFRIGSQDESYHKPILNQYLNNEFVIDISCGTFHSLVLTNCEVYAWVRIVGDK